MILCTPLGIYNFCLQMSLLIQINVAFLTWTRKCLLDSAIRPPFRENFENICLMAYQRKVSALVTNISGGSHEYSKITNNKIYQRTGRKDSHFTRALNVVPIVVVGLLLLIMYLVIRHKKERSKSQGSFWKIICPQKYKDLHNEADLGTPLEDYSNRAEVFEVEDVNLEMTTASAILECMERLMSKQKNNLKAILSQSRPDNSSVALDPENIGKNKSGSIVPFNSSRFVICEPTFSGNDYINASVIKDHFVKNLSYIQTQIPFTPETTEDFWQMVWESRSGIVVCMVDPGEFEGVESDIWPFMSSRNERYEIELLSANTSNESYLVNTVYLRKRANTHTRIVVIFCYLNFDKFGLPGSLEEFSFFRRIVDKSQRSSPGTVVVACSTGGGKSGLFVLADLTLKRLYANSKQIDLRACIEFLQEYRTVVLESEEQYLFAISTVAEEMRAILRRP